MAFQGLFRRHNTFVVVKEIRLNAKETLEVGTVIDMEKDNVKWFQLRLWFRRRKIGTQGSNWANQILGGARRPEGAAINTKRDIKVLTDTLTAVAVKKGEDNPPLISLETLEGAQELLGAMVADATIEPAKVDEPAATEPEQTKEQKDRARKDAKNKRERDRRAAAAAKKAGK